MDKMRLSLFLCTLGIVSATQMTCSSSLNKQLLEAVSENDYAQVDELLKVGASVHAVNSVGETALHYSCAFNGNLVVKRLLRAGADISATNIDGETVLHIAVLYGNESAVQRLLQAGADVNSADVEGDAALYMASDKGNTRVVDWLLQAGADVNATNNGGDTALHWAGNCAIAQRLVQAGADFEALNSQQKSPLVRRADFSRWEEERNVTEMMIGYLISVGAGIDDLLQSDDLREFLRPHVDLIKSRAAFLRDLLNEKQDVYPDLQGLIGQHAGFPISKQAVNKMETILLRDLIENFVGLGYRMPEEVVGKMEACLQ